MSVFGLNSWKLTRIDTGESFDANGRIVEYIEHQITNKDISKANAKLSRYSYFNERNRFFGEYRLHQLTDAEMAILKGAIKVIFEPYSDNVFTFECSVKFTPFQHNNLAFFNSGKLEVESIGLIDPLDFL